MAVDRLLRFVQPPRRLAHLAVSKARQVSGRQSVIPHWLEVPEPLTRAADIAAPWLSHGCITANR
jgi:hypothetical protein